MLRKRVAILAALAATAFPAAAVTAVAAQDAKIGAPEAKNVKIAPLQRPVRQFHRAIKAQLPKIRAKRRERREQAVEQSYALPGGVSQSTLDSIAVCESGGDPTAVSSDGTYRGKYQFDYGTWASVGGSGDPAAAPESEQDMRAQMLMERSGSSPWPVCGS